jgi:hypothetical protein
VTRAVGSIYSARNSYYLISAYKWEKVHQHALSGVGTINYIKLESILLLIQLFAFTLLCLFYNSKFHLGTKYELVNALPIRYTLHTNSKPQ